MSRKQKRDLQSRANALRSMLIAQGFSDADTERIAAQAVTRALNGGPALLINLTDGTLAVDLSEGVWMLINRTLTLES